MSPVDHPVIGFRAWRPSGGEGRLRSCIQDSRWDKLNEAECMRPFHLHRGPAPAEGCECGLYAFHDYAHVDNYAGTAYVSGIVRGWGSVRVHKDGWRAQHAEILAIIDPGTPHGTKRAKASAEYYQVPMIPAKLAPAMVAEFGKVVPEEIRPDSPIMAGARGLSFGEEMVSVAVALTPFVIALAAYAAGDLLWRLWKRRRA